MIHRWGQIQPAQYLVAVRLSLLFIWLAACSPVTPATPAMLESPSPTLVTTTPTRTPLQPLSTPTATFVPAIPAATPQPGLWVAPYLPPAIRQSVQPHDRFKLVDVAQTAQLRLEAGESQPVSQWVYALVAPFPTLIDGVSSSDLRQAWQGEPTGVFENTPILLSENIYDLFSTLWGMPAGQLVKVLPAQDMLGYAWEHMPAWALIPFEDLHPRWKVLEVDGISPIRREFDPQTYALTVNISLTGDPNLVAGIVNEADGAALLGIPTSNRDPAKLTTLVMTGVTALVRATAFIMHRQGLLYPAQDIGELLRSADLTHVSNEVPFSPDCPPPNPSQVGLRFCSHPSYIALLEEVGTDIVELTGDHFRDWGDAAMLYTLDLYKQKGWFYYGGGYDRVDAQQARLIEHNGNRLAFIGCNAKGGGYATASDTQPGAVECDYDQMHSEITRLSQAGYLVIATFQHHEYYSYLARPDQIVDFQGMAQAGAVIVSGSQSHQPQAMEFYQGAFIHYGLGNLFFDQYHICAYNACDDAFIDRHVFYQGKYIATELITIRFVDYARPRFMSTVEREILLRDVFEASGW